MAMQAWLKDGKEPPASEYPRIAKDQLVSLGAYAFPKIPGVEIPTRQAGSLSAGFFRGTAQSRSTPFPTLVPQVDHGRQRNFGNQDAGGASAAGFLHRLESAQQEYRRAGGTVQHGWIVDSVSATKAEREKRKDPRISIEERYPNKGDYLDRITAAAQKLVQSGFLLDQDVPKLRERAAKEWDYVLRSN